ncbi:hypothetical protein PQ469_25010 [Mucilaginibacter sp. KACC 22773]|uniref:hypothetical protein n=1 Tax=Mucilaginibacter sp. KACC 22773 TaxID=3025671 RepID=UPI002365B03D|nr:hypothetical protein [Mucilaginibacter sp. KACC 22773]WDF77150.1 hypothetical protein PQ469_25010 [Mucilaginibacter sp. KACC 22773]
MKALQTNLFKTIEELVRQPLIVAYGLGVDSTAALIEMYKRGNRPDAILFADTGDEKQETYNYLPIINAWLLSAGFPQVTVVRYQPVNFKNWPPYATLGENCLTNGTLPSLAFGFKSCSLKWKIVPQNKWTDSWPMAVDHWRSGGKVKKMIGYDASPKDKKRYAHARGLEDDKYEYWYPLIEWNMDREACKRTIIAAGLPVPPKSACKFCPATQPEELKQHRKDYLRYIVIMEARAKPRLEGCMTADELLADYQAKHLAWEYRLSNSDRKKREKLLRNEPTLKKVGAGCAGLWRKRTKSKPAMMTEYIRAENLLPADEIARLQEQAPRDIIHNQQAFAGGEDILNWHDFLEMFSEEDALDELRHDCINCGLAGD